MGRAKLPPNYGTAAPKRLSRLRAFGVALNVVGWLVRGGQNERHQIIDRGIAYMTVMLEAIQKSQKRAGKSKKHAYDSSSNSNSE